MNIHCNQIEETMANIASCNFGRLAVALSAFWCVGAYAQATPPACANDLSYQQTDFLLGHWDVYEESKKIGEMSFDEEVKGCARRQKLVPTDASGTGFLAILGYSRVEKFWEYLTVTDSGYVLGLNGTLHAPGNFQFDEKPAARASGEPVHRYNLVLQPDGSILEVATSSTDGKTWKTDVQLHWRKKK